MPPGVAYIVCLSANRVAHHMRDEKSWECITLRATDSPVLYLQEQKNAGRASVSENAPPQKPTMDRRTFLRTSASAASTIVLLSRRSFSALPGHLSPRFIVHPFVEQNPSAVFILRTNVDVKTNSPAIYEAGNAFGRSVFLPSESDGFPTSAIVAIKPNLTSRDRSHPQYTIERSMGIVTDASFVEGIIDSLKLLGMAGSQFYIREINSPSDFEDGGYVAMAARTGAEIRSMQASWIEYMPIEDVQWVEVPDGTWFQRIPYLWPVNAPGSYLLNIAKFKAHTMGITGCAKNLQGTCANGYQQHCRIFGSAMNIRPQDMCADANTVIQDNYNRHVADGIPRWGIPGDYGGMRQEIWATRCLDNNSVSHPGLHVIEGIYGRDGNFMNGPSTEGLATDYMTNIVLFGKDPFHVEVAAHWRAGHEPGNFGLFHLAVERGQAATINPHALQVYEWSLQGSATLKPITEFSRTPLKTVYLRRTDVEPAEQTYHLVDEPYDYGASMVGGQVSDVPDMMVLEQSYPNPFNGNVSIRFSMPKDADVLVEIFDVAGRRMGILADGFVQRGAHLVSWNASGAGSGVYFCRLLSGGSSIVRSMVLVR